MNILAQALRPSPLASGMTVAQARRALTDAFRRAGLDSPELDARLLDRPRARSRPHRAGDRSQPQSRRRGGRDAGRACGAAHSSGEPVARIVGGKEFWGLPLARFQVHAGAAAGDRDRGRSRARRDRRRRAAQPRALHRRSRHRLGRAPAGALDRTAERNRHRHRHQRRRPGHGPRQRPAARASRRARISWRAISARRWRGRSTWSCPIRPIS